MSDVKKSPKWRTVLTVVTFFALVALLYFARESISETFSNLGNVTAWVLIFMVVWQIFNYHGYTQLYRYVFKALDREVDYISMIKITAELNFVNTVFPSVGVAGFSYFGYRMKEFGINASKTTLAHLMRFVTVFFSFQVLLVIGVIALGVDGKVNNFTMLVAGSIGTILVIFSVLSIYIVGNKKRIDSFTVGLTKVVNKIIHFVRPKNPETIKLSGVKNLFLELHDEYIILKNKKEELKRPFLYSLLAVSMEIATLYTVFVAFGQPVNPGAVILAYAVANFAGIISVLPGGAGVYEVLMTAVLAVAGVPPSIGLPATIMYRILGMLLQLPIGYYFYQSFLKKAGISRDQIQK